MRDQTGVKENRSMENNDGFTLIEIMFAIFILSFGMIGVWTLQIKAIQNSSLGNFNTTALNIAAQHLEEIINASYTDTNLSDANSGNNTDLASTTNVDYQNIDLNGSAVSFGGGKFTLIRNVAPNTPITNTMTVVVIVTWKNGQKNQMLSCIKSMTS